MRRFLVILLIIVLLCGSLVGCIGEDKSVSTQQRPNSSNTVNSEDTENDAVENNEHIAATEKKMYGQYTLEECKTKTGVFYAWDDGSFSKYPVGGYCYGYSRLSEGLKGLYLADNVADYILDVNRGTKLVAFCDTTYFLTLYPVHCEIPAIRAVSNNAVDGYGLLSNTQDSVYIHYEDSESETLRITYINGVPAKDYDSVKIVREVNPYKGKKTVSTHIELTGFQKGEVVRLGVVDGTAIVEQTYTANATFFDCDNEHNNWDEEDEYGINYGVRVEPTIDGYATIDFSEIPDGKYVMIFRYVVGEKQYYQSTLLNLYSTK